MDLSARVVVVIIVIMLVAVGLFSVSSSIITGSGSQNTDAGTKYNTVYGCVMAPNDMNFTQCQKTVDWSPEDAPEGMKYERRGV